jgi:hypothetical protein
MFLYIFVEFFGFFLDHINEDLAMEVSQNYEYPKSLVLPLGITSLLGNNQFLGWYPHFRKPPSLVFHLVDVLPACRFHATYGYVKSQNFPKPTTLSYHLPRNGTFRTWTCGIIAAESDRLVFFKGTISRSMCFCIAFYDTEKILETMLFCCLAMR